MIQLEIIKTLDCWNYLIVENSSVSSLRPETADAFDRFEAGGEDDQVDQVSLVAGQDGIFRHLGDRVCDQVSLVGLLSVKQGLQTTFIHCIVLKHKMSKIR